MTGRPFDHAFEYLACGWSPLPLPPGKKSPPPGGYTGANGTNATAADVDQWLKDPNNHNIAIRLPPNVVGIDIDNYAPKHGATEIARLEVELGKLPPTWASSSRKDGESGIWYYQIPAGTVFPGKIAPDVEAIQHHHRYATAPPSIHPEGGIYTWYTPDGDETSHPPTPTQLTELPTTWIKHLTTQPNTNGQTCTPPPHNPNTPSKAVDAILGRYHRDAPGGRHDAMLTAVMALARLEHQGHPGTQQARQQIHNDFTARVTTPGPGQRTPQQAQKELNDAETGAQQRLTTQPNQRPHWNNLDHQPPPNTNTGETQTDNNETDEKTETPYHIGLPPEFWSARPHLTHIHQAAHSRTRTPDAVLAATLARISALTPPTIRLPAIVAAQATLDIITATIAPSGGGKTSANTIAAELTPINNPHIATDLPIGSGEGLIDAYLGPPQDHLDPTTGKKIKHRPQKYQAVLAVIDEGQILTDLANRKGTTLLPTLRSAWSGATLGQTNATTETKRRLPAGNYRLAAIIAIQPEHATALINDQAGGTPQRILWFTATDPTIPDQPPPWPGPLNLNLPQHNHNTLPTELKVAQPIQDEIRARALARSRGETTNENPLDSHTDLLQLKTGALLALMDGRRNINYEDWALAKHITQASRRVRTLITTTATLHARQAEQAATERAIRRETALTNATEQRALHNAARTIARRIHRTNGPHTRRELTQTIAGKHRQLVTVDDALAHAIEQGWIVTDGDGYAAGETIPT